MAGDGRNSVGTQAKEISGEATSSQEICTSDADGSNLHFPKSTTPAAERLADARTSLDTSRQELKQDRSRTNSTTSSTSNSKFPLLPHRLSNDSFASYFTAEAHLFSPEINDDTEESLAWKPATSTMDEGSRDRPVKGRIGSEQREGTCQLVRGDAVESARELRREQAREEDQSKLSFVEDAEKDNVGSLPQLHHRRSSIPSTYSIQSSLSTLETSSPNPSSPDSSSRWNGSRRASAVSDYTAYKQSQAAMSKPTLDVAFVPQSIFAPSKKNRPLTDLITLPRFNSLSRLLKKSSPSSPSPPSSPRSTSSSNSKRKGNSNDILNAAIASSAAAPRGGHGHRHFNAALESAMTDPYSNRSQSVRAPSISSGSVRSSILEPPIPNSPRRVSTGGGVQEESH